MKKKLNTGTLYLSEPYIVRTASSASNRQLHQMTHEPMKRDVAKLHVIYISITRD